MQYKHDWWIDEEEQRQVVTAWVNIKSPKGQWRKLCWVVMQVMNFASITGSDHRCLKSGRAAGLPLPYTHTHSQKNQYRHWPTIKWVKLWLYKILAPLITCIQSALTGKILNNLPLTLKAEVDVFISSVSDDMDSPDHFHNLHHVVLCV